MHTHLRCATKRRRKRYGAYDSRGRLAGKRHISERPEAANARVEIGHWEIDTVLGNHPSSHCAMSLVEWVSGYVLIGKLLDRTSAELTQKATQVLDESGLDFLTITADNGTEFHDYKTIEAATAVEFYFATPHHSWERGSNENANGLIRQYLPKGESMSGLTQERCDEIAERLNMRPRKRLGFKTPAEVLYGC